MTGRFHEDDFKCSYWLCDLWGEKIRKPCLPYSHNGWVLLGGPHILEGPGEELLEGQGSGTPSQALWPPLGPRDCWSRDCGSRLHSRASLFQSGNCSTCRGGGREAAAAQAPQGRRKRMLPDPLLVLTPTPEVSIVTPYDTERHPPLPPSLTVAGSQAAETAGGPSLFAVLSGSPVLFTLLHGFGSLPSSSLALLRPPCSPCCSFSHLCISCSFSLELSIPPPPPLIPP